ncbi:hypothetical protein DV515_00007190 [Chloebia gouldiae]|uniref:Uncharacterized protein n=1 Tax=Chloebia gouldiae TaxID=44316 RepID=A0A3L8SJL3_CHLGU|nr:hypothetical protein DV515_00007190 [Chloebia gouldiae]
MQKRRDAEPCGFRTTAAREAAWAARSRPAARSRSWQGRVGKKEREPRSSSPRGESCGSRREACEYTQTLWSLPCKSWQDAASSELIHVRSPAGSGHAGGVVPGAPRDPAPGAARRSLGSCEKSSAHPAPLPPGPSYSSTVPVWAQTAFPKLCRQLAGTCCHTGVLLWSCPWPVGHWGMAGHSQSHGFAGDGG